MVQRGETLQRVHRARLLSRTDDGWLVELQDGGELVEIQTACISRRVQLPWKPAGLRNYLIIFRRRSAEKNQTSNTSKYDALSWKTCYRFSLV